MGRILTVRLARRNNGISEPEHTLYLFVASMILVPFSLVLYGVGVVHHIHWFGLVFSQFLLANSNALFSMSGERAARNMVEALQRGDSIIIPSNRAQLSIMAAERGRFMKNRLEELRKARGIKQEELASALEVSRQTIGSLENGRYNPSILLAFKIARYFGLAIEDIFIYEEEGDT